MKPAQLRTVTLKVGGDRADVVFGTEALALWMVMTILMMIADCDDPYGLMSVLSVNSKVLPVFWQAVTPESFVHELPNAR